MRPAQDFPKIFEGLIGAAPAFFFRRQEFRPAGQTLNPRPYTIKGSVSRRLRAAGSPRRQKRQPHKSSLFRRLSAILGESHLSSLDSRP
jgi:hypothetical protein